MRAHAENAMSVAKYLDSSPLVESTIYPGNDNNNNNNNNINNNNNNKEKKCRNLS